MPLRGALNLGIWLYKFPELCFFTSGGANFNTILQLKLLALALLPLLLSPFARMSEAASSCPIILPKNDKLQYRILELDNGLRAVLVHDPEADKAAASLDVSLQDDLCGLIFECGSMNAGFRSLQATLRPLRVPVNLVLSLA